VNGVLAPWLHPVFFLIEEAWIILYEADKSDLVSDFPNADRLAREDRAQVDLAIAIQILPHWVTLIVRS